MGTAKSPDCMRETTSMGSVRYRESRPSVAVAWLPAVVVGTACVLRLC